MSSATTSRTDSATQGCHEFASLFQDPLLEDPPNASAPAEQRRQHMMLARKAENICHTCPLLQQCLFNAVVKFDVAGFVAGTSARQRAEIRHRLGITVNPEDFDTLAGITARHRQVDHDEVVRLRQANPHESLETLAHRIGCSLSTVKRHLRRHRNETAHPQTPERSLPSMRDVAVAYRQVVAPGTARRAA